MKNKITNPTKTQIKSFDEDLTLKERSFLKRYLETGNGTQSAMEIYDTHSYSSAGAIASQILKKLKNPTRLFLESQGLSIGSLTKKLKEGLDATRTTNAAILITKDGKIEKAEEQGLIETPDYLTRHKYLETASKWIGIEESVKNVNENLVSKITVEEFVSK